MENLLIFLFIEVSPLADLDNIPGYIKGGGPNMGNCLHGLAIAEKALLGLIDPDLFFPVNLLQGILKCVRKKMEV
jgi:hypothetical protein